MSRPVSVSKLTLIKKLDKFKWNKRVGLYLCACGTTCEVIINEVKTGNIKSCGCLHSHSRGKDKE